MIRQTQVLSEPVTAWVIIGSSSQKVIEDEDEHLRRGGIIGD